MNTPLPAPRKRFGQHFLADGGIIAKIVESMHLTPNEAVLEIGPGRGALTKILLEKNINLFAVELDRDLAAMLRATYSQLTLFEADALEFDYNMLRTKPLRLVGNLPYNVATPLIFRFIEHIHLFTDITIMVQKEVADRMMAKSGNPAYGRLSVSCHYFFTMRKVTDVRPGSFFPPPKVMSTVLTLTPKSTADRALCHPDTLSKVVKQAFSTRRKKLSNALAPLFSTEVLRTMGVADKRAEELDLADYIRLAKALH